jgi:hypothetical protein
MTKQEFEIFLDEKEREAKNVPTIDWEARKQEWLKSLEKLYDDVNTWLKTYIESDKIRIEQGEVTLEEQHLAKYKAGTRTLYIGAEQVSLQPVGTLLIGARGRVDMEGPKGTVKFILTGKRSNGIRISMSVADSRQPAPVRASNPRQQEPEEWVWKIATPPPKVEFIELTAEVFMGALMEVVNG